MKDPQVHDTRWMRRALCLATRGQGKTSPNPPVGAVIVRRGRVVGEGYHRVAGGPHAEILAIRQAGNKAQGATLYVSLEPCSTQGRTPPCTDAIIRCGTTRVVAAMPDPNPRHRGRGMHILERAGIQTCTGVCEESARALLAPFSRWIQTGMPYTTLKMAMTLDGRIADLNGKSKWITSPGARSIVHKLRRRVDAVIIGGTTACLDNPSLLTGRKTGRQPRRVIVDSAGRLPLTARVLNDDFASHTVIACTAQCSESRRKQYERKGASVWTIPAAGRRVSLPRLFRKMGKEGFLHVLCEGGGHIARNLVRSDLVDEYMVFTAPKILGGSNVVTDTGPGSWRLAAAPQLRFTSVEQIGPDVLMKAVPMTRKTQC